MISIRLKLAVSVVINQGLTVTGYWSVVSFSSKTGALNTALKELYLLTRSLDVNQTRRRCGKGFYWLKFREDLSCTSKASRPFSAGVSVLSKHHGAVVNN